MHVVNISWLIDFMTRTFICNMNIDYRCYFQWIFCIKTLFQVTISSSYWQQKSFDAFINLQLTQKYCGIENVQLKITLLNIANDIKW